MKTLKIILSALVLIALVIRQNTFATTCLSESPIKYEPYFSISSALSEKIIYYDVISILLLILMLIFCFKKPQKLKLYITALAALILCFLTGMYTTYVFAEAKGDKGLLDYYGRDACPPVRKQMIINIDKTKPILDTFQQNYGSIFILMNFLSFMISLRLLYKAEQEITTVQ